MRVVIFISFVRNPAVCCVRVCVRVCSCVFVCCLFVCFLSVRVCLCLVLWPVVRLLMFVCLFFFVFFFFACCVVRLFTYPPFEKTKVAGL